MIFGTIEDDQPLIPVLIGWRFGVQSHLALMDTGFTGDIKVSPEIATDLGLVAFQSESISLGNDEVIQIPISLGVASMEGVLKSVTIHISNGIPIVGMSFLKKFGYTLMVDPKANVCTLQK